MHACMHACGSSVRARGWCGLKVRKNAAMLLFLQAGAQKCVCFEHGFVTPSAHWDKHAAGAAAAAAGYKRRQCGRASADEQQRGQRSPQVAHVWGGVTPLSRPAGAALQ